MSADSDSNGLDEILLGFRSSVRQWSEEQGNPRLEFRTSSVKPHSWMRGACWTSAALILCLFVGHLIPQRVSREAADAALLQRIDQEVSRTVPGAMQPLTELVSWEGAAR
jgi:hypothetical protein